MKRIIRSMIVIVLISALALTLTACKVAGTDPLDGVTRAGVILQRRRK